jgi:hypothetical protein
VLELSKGQIDELKAKHGRIYELSAGDVSVVVRMPNSAEWREWMASSQKAGRFDAACSLIASERLLRCCLLHPDVAAFELMLQGDDDVNTLATRTLLATQMMEAVLEWAESTGAVQVVAKAERKG